MPTERQSKFRSDMCTRLARAKRRAGAISFAINLSLFRNILGTSPTGPTRHSPARLKLSEGFNLQGSSYGAKGDSNSPYLLIAACFRKPIAYRSKILVPRFREAGDDLFRGLPGDLHTRVDDVSPGGTRVPFRGCSSKPTHCARTTPSEWSIHPTLCAGWQFVITWLTTVFTGSRISISSRLPA